MSSTSLEIQMVGTGLPSRMALNHCLDISAADAPGKMLWTKTSSSSSKRSKAGVRARSWWPSWSDESRSLADGVRPLPSERPAT